MSHLSCLECKNYYPRKHDWSSDICYAFPGGIPWSILSGKSDHSEPLPGQKNTLVFQKCDLEQGDTVGTVEYSLDAGNGMKELLVEEKEGNAQGGSMKQITVFVEDTDNETDNKAVNISEIEQDVRTSFYTQFPGAQAIAVPADNAYIVDVWDEYVIVETGRDYYRVPYEKGSNDDGTVTFVGRTDWQPVEKVWVEVNGEKAVSFKAKMSRATINRLPDSSFLYVEKGGEKDGEGKTSPRRLRHLPYKNQDGSIALPQLRNALSRLGQPATGKTEEGKWLTSKLRAQLQAKARGILAEEQKELGDRMVEIESLVKGGPGSGNFGHGGRPGSQGGSSPGGSSGLIGESTNTLKRTLGGLRKDIKVPGASKTIRRELQGAIEDVQKELSYRSSLQRTLKGFRSEIGTEGVSPSIVRDLQGSIDRIESELATREGAKARSEGQGTDGERQGNLGTDTCVCPKCGHKVEHKKGAPCNETKCPECGATMTGVTEAEAITATGEAGRIVIAQQAGEVESQVKESKESNDSVDNKSGRRVRSDKVSLIKRLAKEFADLKDALMELVGWATYDDASTDEPADELFNMYDLLTNTSAAKALKQASERGSSFLTFKSSDDTDWLLTFTTNAFEDREAEIFTTKSIEEYVGRHQHDDIKGEYQFWHLPGTKFGDIRWQGMADRFLVEAGPFDDTEVGQSFKQFFNQHPDGHPDIAPEGWGCSHKYEYKAHDREDGVYDWFDKSETTVLPADVAANPHNPSLSKLKGDNQMNAKQKAALKVIGGSKLVGLVEEVGRKATEELEGTVEYKAKADSDLPAQLQAIADGMEDEEAKKGVTSVIKAMRKLPPWLQEEADEDDGEDKDKDKDKNEEADDEDKKPKGKKEEEAVEAEPVDEETTPPVEEEAKSASDKEYQEAVAQSFVAITNHTNDQFTEVHNAIKELVKVVKALKEDDDVKIAEKAELTPAASLQEIVNSVIGHKATRVDKRSQYHRDGPAQVNPDADGPSPVPLLNMFISGEDQRQGQ